MNNPECSYCGGPHDWEVCKCFFTPIKECEFKYAEDGTCGHPKNMTPECHVDACPRLERRVSEGFKPDRLYTQTKVCP